MGQGMALDPKKIAALKRKLIEATDFTEIAELFIEDLGNDMGFITSGKPYLDKRFITTVAQAAATAVGTNEGVYQGTPSRVAEHGLIHGAFTFGEWTGMMFFFEDIEQGFLALGDDSGPSRFCRFTFVVKPKGKNVVLH